jgi:peptidoglycan hydrolase-like protein with peptidoglycan-binding domain
MRIKALGAVGVGLLMAAYCSGGNQRATAGDLTVIPVGTGNNVTTDASSQLVGGSTDVRMAQSELKREGLYGGKVDGIAGPTTTRGITAFQQREGLQQTSRLDTATRERMILNALRMDNWSSGTARSNIDTKGRI